MLYRRPSAMVISTVSLLLVLLVAGCTGSGSSPVPATGNAGTGSDGDPEAANTGANSGSPSTSSAAPQRREIVLELQPFKAECEGLQPELCLLVRMAPDEDFGFFYSSIAGFDYSWGVRYQLRVLQTEVPDPPADGSSSELRLLEVLVEEPLDAGSRFDFSTLFAPALITLESPGRYQLARETAFVCAEPVCRSLDDLLMQELSLLLEFRYAFDRPDAELELMQIKCSDSAAAFRASCLP